MARYMRSDLGRGHTNLRPPAVVGAGISWHGPGVYLTATSAAQNRIVRRRTDSILRPPRVVTAAPTQIFFGPSITYWAAVKSRQNTKGQRRGTISVLRPPIPPAPTGIFFGPKINLNVMLPERRRSTVARRSPDYELKPPVVLAENLPTQVTLTRSRRAIRTTHQIFPPAVIGGALVNPGLRIRLVFARRGQPKSRLFSPTVVTSVTEVFYGPSVTLARIRPPRVYPDLGQPIHFQTQALGWIGISLAPSRRPVTKSVLQPPAVVTAVVVAVYYGPQVTLAPSRRPVARYELKPPTVVFLAVEIYGPEQWLAYSRRGAPTSFLRPPAVTASNLPTATTFAPQRRGVPHYRLSAPVVVYLAVEIYGPEVHLTRISPPLAQAFLRPPTVVAVAVEALYGPDVHLTYSRRGRPVYRLEPPTVVFPFFARALPIALAPQARGIPKSRLSPPQVVFLAVEIYGPEQWLAYSRRPVTKSEIKPPTVVAPVVSYGPFQWLTYSRRGKPVYFLRKPTVVASPPAYQQVVPPTFAPQRRGRPTSFLNPPTRVFPFFARKTDITLAPQRRGLPTYFLRGPQALKGKQQLQTNLTYSRRGAPHSFLQPPRVVRLAVEIYGPETWLSYSRRGRPISFRLPEIAGKPPFRAIQVHLTRIKPRPTVSLIKPPTVVRITKADVLRVNLTYSRRGRPINFQIPFTPGRAPFRGIQVHLTRITPRPTVALVKPPTVIGAGIAFYGPLTTFARIKHPPVQHNLRLTLVAFRRPHGDVCGFDIAGSFVCSLELPGSQVSGSEGVSFQITGSSRATTKITGSESAGGSVSGSDRKAT